MDQWLDSTNISAVQEVESVINEKVTTDLCKSLFMHPGTDFQGVTLVAKISGGDGDDKGEHIAWFTREDMCSQNSTHWWEVWVYAYLYKT